MNRIIARGQGENHLIITRGYGQFFSDSEITRRPTPEGITREELILVFSQPIKIQRLYQFEFLVNVLKSTTLQSRFNVNIMKKANLNLELKGNITHSNLIKILKKI